MHARQIGEYLRGQGYDASISRIRDAGTEPESVLWKHTGQHLTGEASI
jgi:hypothetical protein